MKTIILLCALLLASVASAQSAPPYDLNHATFSWVFSGPGDGFTIKCGTTTGVYTRVTNVASGTARAAPIVNAIGGSGNWFCKIFAYTNTASGPLEGQGSLEISFFVAVAPSTPTSFGLVP